MDRALAVHEAGHPVVPLGSVQMFEIDLKTRRDGLRFSSPLVELDKSLIFLSFRF